MVSIKQTPHPLAVADTPLEHLFVAHDIVCRARLRKYCRLFALIINQNLNIMELIHEIECDYKELLSTLKELGWVEKNGTFRLGRYRLVIVQYGNFYTATLGIPQ